MTYVKLTDHQSVQALAVMCRFLGLEGLQAVLGEALLKGASYCALDEQHMVFSQGQPGDYFYLILGGRVDTLRLSAEGEEHIIHHVVAGQLLAPIVMFMKDGRYPVSCRTAEPTQLCRMSRASLHKTCLSHPQLAMQMLELAGRALNTRIDEMDNLVGRNAAERLANYLLRLQPQASSGLIHLPLNQRQLATKLGVRAETLNRLLADWQRQGLVVGQRRDWTIPDRGALSGVANRVA